MQHLHLVGFTTDLESLIFSARRGSKSGGFVVPLDDQMLEVVAEALKMRRAAAGEEGESAFERALAAERAPAARQESWLTPREIQARLRAGRTIEAVAAEAGVDEEWVERFAAPVYAERSQMIRRARGATFSTSRKGESAEPLGVSVRWNVADRGVSLTEDEFEDRWSAYQFQDELWVVRFEFVSRGRQQVAEWTYDVAEGVLASRNRLASDLGMLDAARRRRQPPDFAAPPPRSVAREPHEEREGAPASKKQPAKRKAAKKSRAKKAAKKSRAKKSPPKRVAERAASAKKNRTKKAAPKRAAKKTAKTAKNATKKTAKTKAAPTKSRGKKAAPRRAAKKATAKKATAKKATPKKAPRRRSSPRKAATRREAPRRAAAKSAGATSKSAPASRAKRVAKKAAKKASGRNAQGPAKRTPPPASSPRPLRRAPAQAVERASPSPPSVRRRPPPAAPDRTPGDARDRRAQRDRHAEREYRRQQRREVGPEPPRAEATGPSRPPEPESVPPAPPPAPEPPEVERPVVRINAAQVGGERRPRRRTRADGDVRPLDPKPLRPALPVNRPRRRRWRRS